MEAVGDVGGAGHGVAASGGIGAVVVLLVVLRVEGAPARVVHKLAVVRVALPRLRLPSLLLRLRLPWLLSPVLLWLLTVWAMRRQLTKAEAA